MDDSNQKKQRIHFRAFLSVDWAVLALGVPLALPSLPLSLSSAFCFPFFLVLRPNNVRRKRRLLLNRKQNKRKRSAKSEWKKRKSNKNNKKPNTSKIHSFLAPGNRWEVCREWAERGRRGKALSFFFLRHSSFLCSCSIVGCAFPQLCVCADEISDCDLLSHSLFPTRLPLLLLMLFSLCVGDEEIDAERIKKRSTPLVRVMIRQQKAKKPGEEETMVVVMMMMMRRRRRSRRRDQDKEVQQCSSCPRLIKQQNATKPVGEG